MTCPRLHADFPLKVQYDQLYGSTAIYSCALGYEGKEPFNPIRRCTSDCLKLSYGDLDFLSCGPGYWQGEESTCQRELTLNDLTQGYRTMGRHYFLSNILLELKCTVNIIIPHTK